MQKLIEIDRFYDPEEALCARAFLNWRGVPVLIDNEQHLSVNPALRVALNGYGLLTTNAFVEDARRLLKSSECQAGHEEAASAETSSTEQASTSRPNWLWLPVCFMWGIPFIPRFKSIGGLLWQAPFLAGLYALIFAVYWI